MKKILPIIALSAGILTWLLVIGGITYLQIISRHKLPNLQNPFLPGAFESVIIVLLGAVLSGIGLILSLVLLKVFGRKNTIVVAVVVNGLYVLPVTILLLRQILIK